MNKTTVIIAAIIFILAGILFSGTAFMIRRPSSVQKNSLFKPAGFIFYLIGALTCIYGILALSFLDELTKPAVQLFALIYLIFITAAFSAFYLILKSPGKINSAGAENPEEK